MALHYAVFSQKENTKDNVLQLLPEADVRPRLPRVLGISHIDTLYSTSITCYTDTNLMNYYFSELAKETNPENVVLVVETRGPIQFDGVIHKEPSVWITHTMRELGFTRWVGVDIRTLSDSMYFNALQFMKRFARDYFETHVLLNSFDKLGFQNITTAPIRPLARVEVDSACGALAVIYEKRAYEKHILEVADAITQRMYVPVIITGRNHIPVLQQPCLLQRSRTEDMSDIRDSYVTSRALINILEYFETHYGLTFYNSPYQDASSSGMLTK